MAAPRVSIVIPCYNYGDFLPEAVASVDAIGRPDVELIIVDDGSTDENTKRVVDGYISAGYHVIRQANGGLGRARNAGVRAARAEYILPLDADNKIRREYVEEGIAILDANPKIGVVYGDAQYFGESTGRWVVGPFDQGRLLRWNYIDACAFYRKVIWDQNNGYDADMPVMGIEDWDMWIGARERGWEFAYVEKVLFDYRVRGTSMITASRTRVEATQDYVARKHGIIYRRELMALQKRTGTIKGAAGNFVAQVRRRFFAPKTIAEPQEQRGQPVAGEAAKK